MSSLYLSRVKCLFGAWLWLWTKWSGTALTEFCPDLFREAHTMLLNDLCRCKVVVKLSATALFLGLLGLDLSKFDLLLFCSCQARFLADSSNQFSSRSDHKVALDLQTTQVQMMMTFDHHSTARATFISHCAQRRPRHLWVACVWFS